MADTNTATFDLDDLKSSVAEIHSALSQGGSERDMLQSALQMLDKCIAAMSVLHDGQRDVAKGQRAIKKSQDWLEVQVLELADKQDASLLAIKALLQHAMSQIDHTPGRAGAVGKSRLVAIAGRDRTAPPAITDDPAEMVKKGLVKQALDKMFGPAGGYERAYDAVVAADLLLKGQLSKAEHKVWKRTNRLPDHVKVS
jgi:hypothetical protein